MVSPSNIFVSYSHKDRQDKRVLEELKTMITPMARDGVVILWVDTALKPGDDWEREIRSALKTARVGVLLVSAEFLASEFIDKVELPALVAGGDHQKLILWVLVRKCPTATLERILGLPRIQAAHDINRPLASLGKAERAEVLAGIADAIYAAAATMNGEASQDGDANDDDLPAEPATAAAAPAASVPAPVSASVGSKPTLLHGLMADFAATLEQRMRKCEPFPQPFYWAAATTAFIALGCGVARIEGPATTLFVCAAISMALGGGLMQWQFKTLQARVITARYLNAGLSSASPAESEQFAMESRKFLKTHFSSSLPI